MFEAVAPFDRARVRVEEMIDSGESFTDVEQSIDCGPLSEDHRAALWLVAWSLNERPRCARDRTGALRTGAPAS